jgi:hypothetical protein
MKNTVHAIAMIGSIGLAIFSLTISGKSASLSSYGLPESSEPSVSENLLAQDAPWWQSVLRGERGRVSRDPNSGTYLNENLCAVSPNGGSVETWSSQPLFVWLDRLNIVERIEVYSEESWEPIWNADTGSGTAAGWYIFSPGGLELEEETTYYFAFRMAGDEGRPSASEFIKFELMPADERSDMEAALAAAGVDGEEASLEALQVFGEQSTARSNHFLDMARILFSMTESAERDAYIDGILSYYCQDESE